MIWQTFPKGTEFEGFYLKRAIHINFEIDQKYITFSDFNAIIPAGHGDIIKHIERILPNLSEWGWTGPERLNQYISIYNN